MRAVTARRYGGPRVLALETLPRPRPGPQELLIRVEAFGVTRGDARLRALDAPRGMGLPLRLALGVTRPRRVVPGREFAGTVAEVGPGVTRWTAGTPVMGITPGLTLGAAADYCVVAEGGLLVRRPDTLPVPEAAGYFFGLLTAADFLMDQARLGAHERVLVNGATGAVGAAATWLAARLGATVTALASPGNHDFARALGATETADYRAPPPPGPYDVVLDVAGTLPWRQARPLLTDTGRLGLVSAALGPQIAASLHPNRQGRRLCAGLVKETPQALARALAFHAQGYRPVITALPLDAIVEAHRLASSGHKRGNVVVLTV